MSPSGLAMMLTCPLQLKCLSFPSSLWIFFLSCYCVFWGFILKRPCSHNFSITIITKGMSWAPPWFVQRWQGAFKERMREQGGAVGGGSSSQGSELELQNVSKSGWVSVWLGQLCLTAAILNLGVCPSWWFPIRGMAWETQFSNKTNFCSIKTKNSNFPLLK